MTPELAKPASEIPFAFDCEGSTLVGVIHQATGQSDLGLLTIVAGGPQYRGGCGRQLVELARRISSEGVPVMRFDHRGLGDSAGAFRGFEHIQMDIHRAIEEFRDRAPSVKRIILWGGCDAASAALINAFTFPEVVGIIASNPWITTEETATLARQKHYRSRLLQMSFWLKVLRMEYNILEYAAAALKPRGKDRPARSTAGVNNAAAAKPYLESMLDGLNHFRGTVLFVMSGRSLTSSQFDELLQSDKRWLDAVGNNRNQRIDIADADQTFSSRAGREALLDVAATWIGQLK